jgi:citrate synthase
MDQLAPSVYHDPREVVWKHIVAQAYWDILDIFRRDGVPIDDFAAIRFSFLKSFNSNHDIELLCRRSDDAAATLLDRLTERGEKQTAAAVAAEVAKARESSRRAIECLQHLRQVERAPSYVADGLIMIAGKTAEEFAAHPEYLRATLQLVGEDSPEVAARAGDAWRRGFVLDSELRALVRSGPESEWSANDMLAEVLMREQKSGAYPSMRDYEFQTTRSAAENGRAKLQAIEQGYFLLGRLISCVSLMNEGSAPIDARELDEACPLEAALKQAGIRLTPLALQAFRQFMLVRCTHGLNPGEFTARIAASVRTSFPQSLVASLMVRAGKVHGGALTECMQQLGCWLAASSRDAFAEALVRSGELYGFGHRIHKLSPGMGDEALGGDPRVVFQLVAARKAFPEMEAEIAALEEFARAVRRMKPALSPNTDFSAAVWFHCLGLPPRVGAGFFSIGRLPGMIAQVINELDYKANSLRPPLAVTLPSSV